MHTLSFDLRVFTSKLQDSLGINALSLTEPCSGFRYNWIIDLKAVSWTGGNYSLISHSSVKHVKKEMELIPNPTKLLTQNMQSKKLSMEMKKTILRLQTAHIHLRNGRNFRNGQINALKLL